MPKAKSRFETQLVALVDRVAPGSVTLGRPSAPLYAGKPGYEVTVRTDRSDFSWTSNTLDDALDAAADELDEVQQLALSDRATTDATEVLSPSIRIPATRTKPKPTR